MAPRPFVTRTKLNFSKSLKFESSKGRGKEGNERREDGSSRVKV